MTINERFIYAVNYLVDKQIAKSKKELALNIASKPQNLTEILGGRTSVSAENIANLCEVYKISADWLLTGKGEMLRTETRVGNIQNNTYSDNCTQNNYSNIDALRIMSKMVDLLKEEIEIIKQNNSNNKNANSCNFLQN